MRRLGIAAVVVSTIAAGTFAFAPPAAAATPTLRVGDVEVTEGNTGAVSVKVPVDLSTTAEGPVTVHYQIHPADDSADAFDAKMRSGTVKFSAGQSSKPISVAVTPDTTPESDQHVAVTLSAPSGASIADGDGGVDIVDDDANGPSSGVAVSVGSTSVEEANSGTHLAYIPVVLSEPAPAPLTVIYTVGCSTASFVTDLAAPKTGKITFQAGQQAKTISTKIKADLVPELEKSMVRSFSTPTPGVTITNADSNTTIVDDDTPNPQNDGVLTDCGHGVPGFAKESVPTGTFDAGSVGSIEQVSVANDGSAPHYPTGAAAESGWASSSQDGSAVVFESSADNLVPGDTNGKADVFVRDRRAGTTERVSVKADGSQITSADMGALDAWPGVVVGSHAAISADGRYVVYETPASLVPEDTNTDGTGLGSLDLYLYDRQTHTVDLVSRAPDGTAAGGVIWENPSVSAHGRYVTFTVEADQSALFGPGTTDDRLYVFVHDRLTNTTIRLLDRPGWNSVISADGETVVTDDMGDPQHPALFAVDLANGVTDRVDVASDGTAGTEGDSEQKLFGASVSSDGRYVSFASDAENLTHVSGGANFAFVRDRVAGTTTATWVGNSYYWPLSIDDGAHHLTTFLGLFDLATNTMDFVSGRPESVRALSGDGRYLVYRATPAGGSSDEVLVRRLS
ncbi:MAG: TolB family protein [Acidimicrobiia bacterium]